MSVNTVKKYVQSLERKGFIYAFCAALHAVFTFASFFCTLRSISSTFSSHASRVSVR